MATMAGCRMRCNRHGVVVFIKRNVLSISRLLFTVANYKLQSNMVTLYKIPAFGSVGFVMKN